MEETYDVIVIGAGIGGLITAARYLDIHPTANLIILDRNKHVGGVYSRDRIYPGFHTQFVLGLAEFSDLEMKHPPKEDRVGDCFKAGWLGRYLEEFCVKKVYAGRGLGERCRLGVEVVDVLDRRGEEEGEGDGDGDGNWVISYRDISKNQKTEAHFINDKGATTSGELNTKPHQLKTKKLIIAAGEYSLPSIPSFPGQKTFSGPIIHSTNFGQSKLLETPNIAHIAILGSGKSAADILYMCLKSLPPSTKIHWIVRNPGAFAPLDIPSPYSNAVEAAQTRGMSLLQPCIWHADGWWVWFLHRTWIGVWFVGWIFGLVDKEAKKRAGYTTRGAEARERGFEQLEYSPGIFWQNSAAGALHHGDFWDLVGGRVVVHRGSVMEMGERKLWLSGGEEIECDALVLGTGFQLGMGFMSDEVKARLGLPHLLGSEDPVESKKWAKREKEQEKLVLEKYPILAHPPPYDLKIPTTTPYRLYRGIVPVNDSSRSIVFVNHLVAGNMMMNAEAQAHWAVAYLSNKLKLPNIGEMEREVALQVAYCKKRMLSNGQLGNYMAFDMIVYIDLLMEDLGVGEVWKRKGTWGVNRPEDLGESWRVWVEGMGRRK